MSARAWPAVLLLLAVVLAAPDRPLAAALTDAQRATLLDEAQSAYDRGVAQRRSDPGAARAAFEESARRFAQLVDDGVVNGPLLYDLGNARAQAGEIGLAILAYRRAQRLMPGDDRLEHNLAYVRSLRRSRIEPSGERALAGALLAWHRRIPAAARFTTFAVAYVLLWLLLAASVLRPGGAWRWPALAAAVIAAVAGASVAFDLLAPPDRGGVVIADDVIVRKGNGTGFEPQFAEPVHQGVEFELITERDGWLQVELPDGKTGWLPPGSAALID